MMTTDEVFIVFDTETTGLKPDEGATLVELAAIPIINGEIRRDCTFETLIDPGFAIPQEASKVHGITNVEVAGCPKIDEVVQEFCRYVGPHDLVAQNAPFDMGFIEPIRRRLGVSPFFGTVHDTLEMSRSLYPDEKRHRLSDICRRLKIQVEDAHRAAGDAFMTAQVFLRLKEMMNL